MKIIKYHNKRELLKKIRTFKKRNVWGTNYSIHKIKRR